MNIKFKWNFIFLPILLLLFTNLSAQNTEFVFIAVIDGARYSETFGDGSHQYIPNIWNDLRPQATIYTSFYNDGGTYTVPGHSSIITGTWQDLPNDGSQRPTQPTLFEYYRKQYGAVQSKNYVILGKDKLDVLAYGTHPDYGSSYRASVKYSSSQYVDQRAWENLTNVASTDHPKFFIINFPEVDDAGHYDTWEAYLTALKASTAL